MVLYLNEVDAYKEFVDGLKRAAGCAHGLAHYQQNSGWFKIRDLLEQVIEQGEKLVTSKSMPRELLLSEMDKRSANLPKDINGN